MHAAVSGTNTEYVKDLLTLIKEISWTVSSLFSCGKGLCIPKFKSEFGCCAFLSQDQWSRGLVAWIF